MFVLPEAKEGLLSCEDAEFPDARRARQGHKLLEPLAAAGPAKPQSGDGAGTESLTSG
jgi:hypothetical protein